MAQVSGSRTGREASGWVVGASVFAASMMMLVGSFHVIAGLTGIIENEFFVSTPNYVFEFDVTAWGWIHLIGGIVVVWAGFSLFNGAVWARSVGVIIAIVSAIANFMFLPYYPVWSIIVIALDVLVIWALTVHGRDIANEPV